MTSSTSMCPQSPQTTRPVKITGWLKSSGIAQIYLQQSHSLVTEHRELPSPQKEFLDAHVLSSPTHKQQMARFKVWDEQSTRGANPIYTRPLISIAAMS